MRRVISGFLAIIMFCSVVPTAGAVGTSALSAILVDADSGRVLYAKDPDTKRAIASITKMMTALVALEEDDDLERVVTIKREYTGVEGSSMYLKAGEQITMRELFYGLMLNSGNDAAVAVACITAGSEARFVKRMNDKARELGMKNTNFTNPHGLSDEGHYSTARDMAILAAACLKNDRLVDIFSTKSVTIGGRTMTNHNKLLWQYEGCIGMKTGYTLLAGRTLISCAKRNGQSLIAVTLNDGNDWEDHKALLDYGFSTYPRKVIQEKGTRVMTLPVVGSLTRFVSVTAKKTVSYPMKEGERVTAEYDLPDRLIAPVAAGQTVGSITYYLNGEQIGKAELVCSRAVPSELSRSVTEKGFWQKLFRTNAASDRVNDLPASG